MEKDCNFQPKYSNDVEIQEVCANLFEFIHHSQYDLSIEDLIKQLQVPGSKADINENVINALKDIHLYEAKNIVTSTNGYNTINIDKNGIEDLKQLQKCIGKRMDPKGKGASNKFKDVK